MTWPSRDPQWLKTSLEVGDHRVPGRRLFWAALAFIVVFAAAMTPFRRSNQHPENASTIVYVSNPTGHGIRFIDSIVTALNDRTVVTWCDGRLDKGLGGTKKDFPSIAPRSLARHIGFRHLKLAVYDSGRATPTRDVTTDYSPLYWHYLLFAQRVRYALAIERLSNAEVKVLLSDMDRNSGCAPVVMAAKDLGIPTATLVHGAPSRHYLPILSSHVLAWSTLQRDWFRASGVSCDIHIVGRPDISFSSEDSAGTRIVVAHSREILTDNELRRLKSLLTQAGKLGIARCLRLHPQTQSLASEGNWTEMSFDTVEFADGGLDWLRDCKLLLTVSSTSAIDALGYGVPCIVVADASRELPCELEYLRIISDRSESSHDLKLPLNNYLATARSAILPLVGADASMCLSNVIDQIAHSSTTVEESRG